MNEEANNRVRNYTVIVLGKGMYVSNWGSHNGVPALFLERVVGNPGVVGEVIEEGREPQIKMDSVSSSGLVIEFHSPDAVDVLMQDIEAASRWGEQRGKVV